MEKLFINSLNTMIEEKTEALKLPFLMEYSEDVPKIIIEDIQIREINWSINETRSDMGQTENYYNVYIKDVGVLKVFDSGTLTETFFDNKFEVYYEDDDRLIVDYNNAPENSLEYRIELFMNMMEFSNILLEHSPEGFMPYMVEELKQRENIVVDCIKSYFGFNNISIEFAGKNIDVYIDDKETPLILACVRCKELLNSKLDIE